ncbi:MAG: energy-coupling factor transporter ATPase [Eubacteriales bacterium]|nr:energy-coupling factor transporter ATPase [Eubacteriales bacterium]
MPISLNHVNHTYMPGSPFQSVALNDVSFELVQGEFLGVIGHTGSGKSTFAQHLNGLLLPNSGTVLIDGIDISAKTPEARQARRRVGLVFQYPEYQLFEETVAKDIAFGPKNMGLSEKEIAARVTTAAEAVGLSPSLLERSPFELSGGQKRRVAIAGVLAMEPTYIVLDEPAAGLDPQGRRDMEKLLRRLHEDPSRTLVMISHSMDDVARLCDRLLVMEHGRVAVVGTPIEVFRQSEELSRIGLDLPEGEKLARRLRNAGFAIPEGTFDPVELARCVAAHGKGGAHDA